MHCTNGNERGRRDAVFLYSTWTSETKCDAKYGTRKPRKGSEKRGGRDADGDEFVVSGIADCVVVGDGGRDAS